MNQLDFHLNKLHNMQHIACSNRKKIVNSIAMVVVIKFVEANIVYNLPPDLTSFDLQPHLSHVKAMMTTCLK